jgi:hypothetical protein
VQYASSTALYFFATLPGSLRGAFVRTLCYVSNVMVLLKTTVYGNRGVGLSAPQLRKLLLTICNYVTYICFILFLQQGETHKTQTLELSHNNTRPAHCRQSHSSSVFTIHNRSNKTTVLIR